MGLPGNIDLTEARVFHDKSNFIPSIIKQLFSKEKLSFVPEHLKILLTKYDYPFNRPASFPTKASQRIFHGIIEKPAERFYQEGDAMPLFVGDKEDRALQKREYEYCQVMIKECMCCGKNKEHLLFRHHDDMGLCKSCHKSMAEPKSFTDMLDKIQRRKNKEFIESITEGPLKALYSEDELMGIQQVQSKLGWFRQ